MSVARNLDMSGHDAKSEMTTVTMVVTPEQAQAWLDTMPTQRKLRNIKIRRYLRLVAEGRWKLLPHGLVIDWDGQLRDGQHRCKVCVLSGKSLPMRVTFNADPSLYLDIDDGISPKTVEDMLKYEGVRGGLTTILPMAIRMLFREERGVSVLGNEMSPSNAEAQEIFHRNLRLVEAGELAARCRLAPSLSILCFPLYKGLLLDETLTRIFVDQVADGEGLRVGDPALLLRNTWINDRAKLIKREPVDQLIMVITTLIDAIRGNTRKTWRNVEFGKGKIPPIQR